MGFKIMIEGDYACFTRPELKVERVSYDVPTPSALEGLLKSIYWKPAIRYCIDKIIVFNPIEYTTIKRNEVSEKVSLKKVKQKMEDPSVDVEIHITENGPYRENRDQRSTVLLKNVKYGVEFHFELTGIRCERENAEGDPEGKHASIIQDRLELGQHFRMPHLGCREFSVKKITLVDSFDLDCISPEILELGDFDLGYMLYGLNFENGGLPKGVKSKNDEWKNPIFSDVAKAIYYHPHMINGIIDVSKYRKEQKC